jgi:hypothetical protein
MPLPWVFMDLFQPHRQFSTKMLQFALFSHKQAACFMRYLGNVRYRPNGQKNKALLGGFSNATGQMRKEVGGLLGLQAWQFFR